MAAEGGPIEEENYATYVHRMAYGTLAGMSAGFLSRHAMTAAHLQQTSEAVDDISAIFDVARAVSMTKRSIPQYKSSAIISIGLGALEDVIDPGALTATQVHRFVDMLDPSEFTQSFSEAYAVDGYLEAHWLHKEMSGEWIDLDDYRPRQHEQSFLKNIAWQFYGSPLGQPLRNTEAIAIVQESHDAASLLALPYYETKGHRETVERRIKEIPFYKPTLRLMSGLGYTRILAAVEARSNLARIGLLLELFYSQRGFYPETLDAIGDDIDDGIIPIDPFSGESFRYIPSESTFLLYSIGGNEVDDGGEYRTRLDSIGDIVWRGTKKVRSE